VNKKEDLTAEIAETAEVIIAKGDTKIFFIDFSFSGAASPLIVLVLSLRSLRSPR
jgi:hypothetical protein